jgi:serine/threonine protein kinase
VGVHDDQPFVVSELLEGRTLRETLSAGALTVRKAVAFALQIAQGLGAAHEKGIVHRDLKPENLLVTNDDRIKILDFGLARMVRESPVAGVDVVGGMATRSMDGVVVGTVGYMAPEQVRGEAVDHRADIFSFGAVFYEMLTRRRAFHRDSVPGTLTAILDADPPSWDG